MVELTALSSRISRANALISFMFHTVVQWGFAEVARNIIYFVDNLSLYPTMKELLKLVNSKLMKLLQKCDTMFFWDTVYIHKI